MIAILINIASGSLALLGLGPRSRRHVHFHCQSGLCEIKSAHLTKQEPCHWFPRIGNHYILLFYQPNDFPQFSANLLTPTMPPSQESLPSTSSGVELGRVNCAGKPVVSDRSSIFVTFTWKDQR